MPPSPATNEEKSVSIKKQIPEEQPVHVEPAPGDDLGKWFTQHACVIALSAQIHHDNLYIM